MRYIQLGNNGGLGDPTQTNSSFLFQIKDNYLLFDCGYNVMAKLVELENDDTNDFHISKIKWVFISHLHDDHVGNVETLMFWNYFKNNKKMIWFSGNDEVHKYLINKTLGTIKNSYKNIPCNYAEDVMLLRLPLDIEYGYTIQPLTQCFHGSTPSNGLVITENYKQAVIVTGDTIATSMLQEEIELICKQAIHQDCNGKTFWDKIKIYHDYSNWDCPSKNVHMTKSNMLENYTLDFISALTFYHKGDDFFEKGWQ